MRTNLLNKEPAGGQRILILGAGGHSSVVHDMLITLGMPPCGVIDPALKRGDLWEGLPVLGDDDYLSTLSPDEYVLANGLGANPDCTARNRLYAQFRHEGFCFPPLVHPSAVLARDIALELGCQVMAGAVLQSGVTVGENCVVNTRASIDHHCRIESDAFISSGAVLCGGVFVEKGAFVGAGAVIIPGVRVGKRAVIGAGTVVLRDVPDGALVVGNPAHIRQEMIK